MVLDSDVIAQIEEDKRLEKYFNQVTDPICDIIYKHNSFDYVPINNKTIAWFKKCKQDLIFFTIPTTLLLNFLTMLKWIPYLWS